MWRIKIWSFVLLLFLSTMVIGGLTSPQVEEAPYIFQHPGYSLAVAIENHALQTITDLSNIADDSALHGILSKDDLSPEGKSTGISTILKKYETEKSKRFSIGVLDKEQKLLNPWKEEKDLAQILKTLKINDSSRDQYQLKWGWYGDPLKLLIRIPIKANDEFLGHLIIFAFEYKKALEDRLSNTAFKSSDYLHLEVLVNDQPFYLQTKNINHELKSKNIYSLNQGNQRFSFISEKKEIEPNGFRHLLFSGIKNIKNYPFFILFVFILYLPILFFRPSQIDKKNQKSSQAQKPRKATPVNNEQATIVVKESDRENEAYATIHTVAPPPPKLPIATTINIVETTPALINAIPLPLNDQHQPNVIKEQSETEQDQKKTEAIINQMPITTIPLTQGPTAFMEEVSVLLPQEPIFEESIAINQSKDTQAEINPMDQNLEIHSQQASNSISISLDDYVKPHFLSHPTPKNLSKDAVEEEKETLKPMQELDHVDAPMPLKTTQQATFNEVINLKEELESLIDDELRELFEESNPIKIEEAKESLVEVLTSSNMENDFEFSIPLDELRAEEPNVSHKKLIDKSNMNVAQETTIESAHLTVPSQTSDHLSVTQSVPATIIPPVVDISEEDFKIDYQEDEYFFRQHSKAAQPVVPISAVVLDSNQIVANYQVPATVGPASTVPELEDSIAPAQIMAEVQFDIDDIQELEMNALVPEQSPIISQASIKDLSATPRDEIVVDFTDDASIDESGIILDIPAHIRQQHIDHEQIDHASIVQKQIDYLEGLEALDQLPSDPIQALNDTEQTGNEEEQSKSLTDDEFFEIDAFVDQADAQNLHHINIPDKQSLIEDHSHVSDLISQDQKPLMQPIQHQAPNQTFDDFSSLALAPIEQEPIDEYDAFDDFSADGFDAHQVEQKLADVQQDFDDFSASIEQEQADMQQDFDDFSSLALAPIEQEQADMQQDFDDFSADQFDAIEQESIDAHLITAFQGHESTSINEASIESNTQSIDTESNPNDLILPHPVPAEEPTLQPQDVEGRVQENVLHVDAQLINQQAYTDAKRNEHYLEVYDQYIALRQSLEPQKTAPTLDAFFKQLDQARLQFIAEHKCLDVKFDVYSKKGKAAIKAKAAT